MMNNGVIDLIVRIKNGYQARRETITTPSSRFKREVLKKLEALGYIESYEKVDDINYITIHLKYESGTPALTGVKLYSKPGRRWYVAAHDLKPVLSGLGHSILSTSKGIMTNREARTEQVGGELLFDLW
ncbi:30S ribosomal protein S8 [Candidatus Microgenomates bacterium]|nr:30S ribosomal protein S8 [Candidatus Microgenomates bacterium]